MRHMRHRSEDESGRRAQQGLGDDAPHTLADLLATVPTGVPSQASLTSRLSELSQLPPNVPHLRFRLASSSCLLPLDRLGGVLAERPRLIHLPYSPEWMLGVFPHRTGLVALVDPVPVLTGLSGPVEVLPPLLFPTFGVSPSPPPVLIVGSGERTLAWTVERITDIVYVQDREVDSLSELATHPSYAITPRYISGVHTADPAAHDLVLAVDQALDDMLAALVEREEKDDTNG